MKLTKNQIYIVLIGTISLVMLIDKSLFLLRTDFTEGVVLKRTLKNTSGSFGGTSSFQLVEFTVENKKVRFSTSEYANYRIGEKVKVVYLKSDITKAKIFSFSDYWLPGFTRGLFVFIIVSGIVFAFMRRNELIVINFKKPFSISKNSPKGQEENSESRMEAKKRNSEKTQRPRLTNKRR